MNRLTLVTESIIIPPISEDNFPEEELSTLKAFYAATGGDSWKVSWDIDNDDPTTWAGVIIENGHVTGIELSDNNLQKL